MMRPDCLRNSVPLWMEPGEVRVPRREDLRSVLVIGSGPIVIGQACEFDYSGTHVPAGC